MSEMDQSKRVAEYRNIIQQENLSDTHDQRKKIPLLFYKLLTDAAIFDESLLLEALLRRGFLAFRDTEGVWLGTGSHPDDPIVLGWIQGIGVSETKNNRNRMARVEFTCPRSFQLQVVESILAIPQNMGFMGRPAYQLLYKGHSWLSYRNTVWGTKLSVCPSSYLGDFPLGYDALDVGIALLVKAWPLARVSTAFVGSCDGHGGSSSHVKFETKWDDIWARAVFNAVNTPTLNSIWFDGDNDYIKTINGKNDDQSVLAMMEDIQSFARRLMHTETIEKVGIARAATLRAFGSNEPRLEKFAAEANMQLTSIF